MKHRKTMLGIGIVLLFTIFACFPLFGKGYIPTHDGEYHIIRFIEFFRMISAGYWFPRWAPTLNSGYGIPIFSFHYPFPNYVGAMFMFFGWDAVYAFKLSMALGYIVAGVSSFLWLSRLFGRRAGLAGSITLLMVPYFFVDMYVRGSVGEIWAIALLSLSFCLLEYGRMIPYIFASALVILSHNILAMLFLPFLFGYALIRKKIRYGFVLGISILLSTYFWLPAIVERVYVVGLNTVNYREHFAYLYELIIPSWGTELSGQTFTGNKMSFQIGVVAMIGIFGTLIISFRDKHKEMKRIWMYFFCVCFAALFLTLSQSMSIWEFLGTLQLVQYPWRFLSFVILTAGVCVAYICFSSRKKIIPLIFIIGAIIFSYHYTRPVEYSPRDTEYYVSRKNFMDGTSSMGNSFSTIWTGWKESRSPFKIQIRNGMIVGGMGQDSYLNKKFSIKAESDARIHMPILYFPGWTVLVDGKKASIDYEHSGTVQADVPYGEHVIAVYFTETPIRILSNSISILTFICLAGWGILGLYAHRNRHFSSFFSSQRKRFRSLRTKSH